MRAFLKELVVSDEDGRRAWYLIVLALAAVIAQFMSNLCREKAEFYLGATWSMAGQTLRCLVYKRLAQADFMF